MAMHSDKKYFIASALFHLGLLLVFVLGFDFASPMIVIENTNKQDVISAVILGDTAKSKIMPERLTQTVEPPVKEKEKEIAKPKEQPAPKVEKAIALKPPEKKKPSDIFGKDLLADLEKFKKKTVAKKKQQQKKLQDHFQKTLQEQAEKSMRRNLLNEDIKLKGTQSRESQGIVNKYQALIQQAISEHWVIPPQANKKRYSVLLIRLAPGGVVLDVQVTRSSGDPALDNSARAAVFKASPLPVPSASADFEPFRQFNLKAKPENIIES